METKKIVITGGANRIGRAIALELADYDTQIVIHYSKSFIAAKKLKIELENLGSVVHLFKADLKNLKQTQKIIPFAYKKMRGLNCLVNNASIFENDNLSNFSEKSFIKHINVNLKAPAILIRDFAKKYKGKDGSIINIVDQRIEKLTPFFFSYTLSKSGLATLTKTSAMKLAPSIRVNAVSPGPTLKNKRQSEKHFEKQWRSTILEKKVDTKNVSYAVKFLIKNNNITGQIINVDSGQRLAWQTPDIINSKE